ncbi:hypothetical protein RIVM261_073260 [Rivularia sp. IAM M-261]|nr:hypothetical protein RIVM261_073260 [Rivularia sp. IAM M-261]
MLQHVNKNNDNFDQELRELVLTIKALPKTDRARRKAINDLISKIQNAHNLKINFGEFNDLPNFQDLYTDALSDTLVYIIDNIETYNPEGKVMAWVNKTITFKFWDVCYKQVGRKGQKQAKNQVKIVSFPEGYETPAPSEEDKLLREFLEQDTGELLNKLLNYINQETQVKGRILLKEVLLMLLDGDKQKDIRSQLHIPAQSLSSFIKRNGEDAINYLRENGFDFEPNIQKKRKVDGAKSA